MSVKAVLDVARSNIGYRESYNNGTKFGRELGVDHESWCAIFLKYCDNHGNEKNAVPAIYYCPDLVDHYKSINRFSVNFNQVERGNDIFWDWNRNGLANHVEKVESCETDKNGNVTAVITIGGNTGPNSDGVYRQRRSSAYFLGVGRPMYSNWDTAWPGKLLVDGSNNFAVGRLQRKLKIKDDNEFGSETLATVKKFQRSHGLKDDGQVGLLTWGKLFG